MGPVVSFVKVRVVPPSELVPLSRPVIVSVGAELAPLDHAKKFESYGPPAGVVTVLPVKVQLVLVPPSALNWLETLAAYDGAR